MASCVKRHMRSVWVADRPLDNSECASGEALLQVEIAEEILTDYEWIGKDKPYREWLVPAHILNKDGHIKLIEEN